MGSSEVEDTNKHQNIHDQSVGHSSDEDVSVNEDEESMGPSEVPSPIHNLSDEGHSMDEDEQSQSASETGEQNDELIDSKSLSKLDSSISDDEAEEDDYVSATSNEEFHSFRSVDSPDNEQVAAPRSRLRVRRIDSSEEEEQEGDGSCFTNAVVCPVDLDVAATTDEDCNSLNENYG